MLLAGGRANTWTKTTYSFKIKLNIFKILLFRQLRTIIKRGGRSKSNDKKLQSEIISYAARTIFDTRGERTPNDKSLGHVRRTDRFRRVVPLILYSDANRHAALATAVLAQNETGKWRPATKVG